MIRLFRFCSLLGILVISGVASAEVNERDVAAKGRVEVTVRSGRLFIAEIDSRTDTETLWIKYGTGNTTIWRPIQWKYVEKTECDGEPLKKSEIIEIARKSTHAEADCDTSSAQAYHAARPDPAARRHRAAKDTQSTQTRTTRVRSARFNASLGNWDADVEPDGLVLDVTPLDESGRPLNVDSVLHVTLFASKAENFDSVSGGERIERIGQWTVTLDRNQWQGYSYVVRLPFQAVDPGFDTTVAAEGLVHTRLVVPGHGTFDRSIDGVQLRKFGPLRDWLERRGQSRWLPQERTGRN